MHAEQFEYVRGIREKHPFYFLYRKVLEIGSLNINGTIRVLFEKCDYFGIDVGPGKDVDCICLGHEFNKPDNFYDVVISCETLEHDPHWKLTFKNMIRLCKPGGIVIVTCATTGRKEHGTLASEPQSSPNTVKLGWEHYKNLTEQDLKEDNNLDDLFYFYHFETNRSSHDLYFYGIKC